ncbi:hypothetical protein HII31_02606 [Pseudocercospora fuligena]|uniref:Ubiquitin-like protease family profile domain-containing protein n=1 Tax=Pseudocercospora fuligena TaxID=685502 RepID=A0A8H6VR89_9PEZI|nr:hypothetical protein HII31_02606 [Pseudocercospora fuligena]
MKRIRTRSQYVSGDDDISPVVATNDPEKILAHKEQEVEEVDTKESIRDREAAKAEGKAEKEAKDAEEQSSRSKGRKKAATKKAATKKTAAPKAAGVKKSSTKKGGKRGPKKGKGKAAATARAAEDEEEPEVPAAETAGGEHEVLEAIDQQAEPASGPTSTFQETAPDAAATSVEEGETGHVDDQTGITSEPQQGSDSHGGVETSRPQGDSMQTEQYHEDIPAITPAPARISSVTSPVQEEPVTTASNTSVPSFDSNQAGEVSGDIPHALAPQPSFTCDSDAQTTAVNNLAPSGGTAGPNTTEVEGSESIASAQATQTMANEATTLSSGGPPSGQPAFDYSATVFPGAYTQPRRRSEKSSKDDDDDDGSKRKKSGGDEIATGASGRVPSADPCKEYPARLQELERRSTHFKITAEDPVVEGVPMLDETLHQAVVSVAERVTENNKGVRFAYLPPVGIAALQFPGMSKPGQQTARPGRPLIFPYSTMDNVGQGHHSLFVVDRREGQDFEIYHYDSAKRTGHRQDFQEHVGKFKDLLRDLGWARNTGLSIPETAHPSTNRIRQNSSWECGLHTVFNAWAIALGLEIASGPATTVRNFRTFQRDGVRMINLARETRMDSKTIEAFLKCYGFVAAGASVPADRAFEETIAILTSDDLNAFIDRIRLSNDLAAWQRNDPSIPDQDDLEKALRESGRTKSEIDFDFQDSSETILARYREEFQHLQPGEQDTSASGPAVTSSNQLQNQQPANEADDDAYEPELLPGPEVNAQDTDSQLPRVVSPQAEHQDVSPMTDGRNQIAEFINRHGTPEQRQLQREAATHEQARRSGGSPSTTVDPSAANVADGHPASPPPNTAVAGTALASDSLASIQTHLAQDAQSRQAAAASTSSPTTPPNTSVLLDVLSGNRISTPEPRSARESEAVTTILESVAQPDPLDREERATGPPAHDPNPLTEPEDPGLKIDDDLFGEDGDDDEEVTITTSLPKAQASGPTVLALPPQTPREPQQTFLPGLRPSQGSPALPPASPPRGTVRPREDDEDEVEVEKPKKLARFLKETETHEERDEDLDEILRGGDDDDDEDDNGDQQGNDEYAEMLRRQGVNIDGEGEDGDGEEDIYGD